MGVWDFLKDAGKELFGGGSAAAAEAPRTDAIKQEMKDLGLDTTGLDLKVEGDKVIVKGKAVDPETKERVVVAAGNVKGVAQVQTDTDEDLHAATFHTVQKGDTLSAIAKKTLGDADRYRELFEANQPMLSDPDKIYPGQVLRIPLR
jgi:nucleoid-associated protein YgaU